MSVTFYTRDFKDNQRPTRSVATAPGEILFVPMKNVFAQCALLYLLLPCFDVIFSNDGIHELRQIPLFGRATRIALRYDDSVGYLL